MLNGAWRMGEGSCCTQEKKRKNEQRRGAGGPGQAVHSMPASPEQPHERREIRAETEPEPNSSSVPGQGGRGRVGGKPQWTRAESRESGGEPPRRAEIEPLSKGVSLLRACRALGRRRWVMVPEYERGTWRTARKGREIRRARTVGGGRIWRCMSTLAGLQGRRQNVRSGIGGT